MSCKYSSYYSSESLPELFQGLMKVEKEVGVDLIEIDEELVQAFASVLHGYPFLWRIQLLNWTRLEMDAFI